VELTLAQIAEIVKGECSGAPETTIRGVAKIGEADPGTISFLANTKYYHLYGSTGASCVLVPPDFEETGATPVIKVENPYFAFVTLIKLFHPPQKLVPPGVHRTAIVGKGTTLGEDVAIGPYVVIGDNCRIGRGTVIASLCTMEEGVSLGEECLIYSQVVLRHGVQIGSRVVLHSGVVVGSDGFGFAQEKGVYHKIPQVGTVVIEDDVEIGANSTIDRATLGETRIKKGVKLDNLIQVAHNCVIGENTVMAAQTGLSGSTIIGRGVRVGGQVGFAGHMEVGDNAVITAQSGISKSVEAGEIVSGSPAGPHRRNMRIEAAVRRLPELLKEIKRLKEKIERLEQS